MASQRVKTAAKGASRVFDGGNQGKEEATYSRYAGQHASGACSWSKGVDLQGGAVLAGRLLRYKKGEKDIVVALGYGVELERMVNGMAKVKVLFRGKVGVKFVHRARCCVVERTFAWLNWSRRLWKAFELSCIYAEHMLRLAAIALTIKQFH